MAAGWTKRAAATVLFVVGVLARAGHVSAGFERAESCPDGTRTHMDFSAVQRAWLQTGDVSVTLLEGKGGCVLEENALFRTRARNGNLIVRKETKPRGKVCEVAVPLTGVPAPGNQLFVSCLEDKMAATAELRALSDALAAKAVETRRIGRTMGGFTPPTAKPSSGPPKATELPAHDALATLEDKAPPTPPPTDPEPTPEVFAPTEAVSSTVKRVPSPTVLATEIKVFPTSSPTTAATTTVPPSTTVVPSTTLPPTTKRETVTPAPTTTSRIPGTAPPTTTTRIPVTAPPTTTTEEPSTPPPPTTTEEPPSTQPPTTSERPTTRPPPTPSEASRPADAAAATVRPLEEDAERFGERSGTPPSPEATHEESQGEVTELLMANLPYFVGGAAGVLVLILLIIVLVTLSKRRAKKARREEPIVLGSANYRRQQDDLDSHDQDHVNIMMYSADEQEEAPPHNELEERILKPPGGASSTPATPRCLRDKNFD